MDIKIYEDQTGQMFYPEKRTDKDRDIYNLFLSKIDIFIKKTNDNIEISCYALIQKTIERAIGCYIIYKGNKYDHMFTEFKNEANKALTNLGFKISNDDVENAILNNLEKFDTSSRLYNTNIIIDALNSGDCLYYGGGNISEIGGFCKDILSLAKNVKISISSKENTLGEINILRNTTYEEHLSPFDTTKHILDKQQDKIAQKIVDDRRKIENERKDREKQSASFILDDSVNSIEKTVNTLKNAGFTRVELIPFFNIYTTRINKIFGYEDEKRPQSYIESSSIDLVTTKEREKELEREIDKDREGEGISKTHIALIGISLVLLALSVGTYGVPYLLSAYHNIHPGPAPEPTSIPATINATPNPTMTMTLTPAPTEINNYAANITNNNVSTNETNIPENEKNISTNVTPSSTTSNPLIGISPTPIRIPRQTPTSTTSSSTPSG